VRVLHLKTVLDRSGLIKKGFDGITSSNRDAGIFASATSNSVKALLNDIHPLILS